MWALSALGHKPPPLWTKLLVDRTSYLAWKGALQPVQQSCLLKYLGCLGVEGLLGEHAALLRALERGARAGEEGQAGGSDVSSGGQAGVPHAPTQAQAGETQAAAPAQQQAGGRVQIELQTGNTLAPMRQILIERQAADTVSPPIQTERQVADAVMPVRPRGLIRLHKPSQPQAARRVVARPLQPQRQLRGDMPVVPTTARLAL